VPIGATKLEFTEAIYPKREILLPLAEALQIKDGIVHHLCFSVDKIEKLLRTSWQKESK